jgi:hypothetical protein
MFKRIMITVVLGGLAIGIAANAAPPAAPINAGKWEITIHTTEPVDSPPLTSVACLSAEAIAMIGPPVSKASHNCQLAGPPGLVNGVLTYRMVCPKLGRTATTKITYSGDSYTGSVVIEHADGTVTKQTISGKRLGDCDPQD